MDARSLLSAIRARDADALRQLVIEFDSPITKFAFLMCGDAELAKDATQETWEKLWARPPLLRDPSKLRSWLLSVTANNVRQVLRGRSRQHFEVPELPPVTDRHEEFLDLRAALEHLNPEQRALLAYRYGAGFSAQELAPLLGISAEGVRTRLHRAVSQLRRELQP